MFAGTTRWGPRLWRVTGLIVAASCFISPLAHADLGTAVEFYNATLHHYFITAYPEEAAALDAGTNVKGWTRTGGQFTVFTDPAEGLQAVCRFFGTPGEGPTRTSTPPTPPSAPRSRRCRRGRSRRSRSTSRLPANGDCGGN